MRRASFLVFSFFNLRFAFFPNSNNVNRSIKMGWMEGGDLASHSNVCMHVCVQSVEWEREREREYTHQHKQCCYYYLDEKKLIIHFGGVTSYRCNFLSSGGKLTHKQTLSGTRDTNRQTKNVFILNPFSLSSLSSSFYRDASFYSMLWQKKPKIFSSKTEKQTWHASI